MYAAGKEHPNRAPSKRLLERIVADEIDAATDSEALQEILYRYWHLGLAPKGIALVNHVIQIIPVILPVEKGDVLLASDLLKEHQSLEPRDAIHAAIMLNHGMTQLYSYDHHFEAVAGLKRLEPAN